MISVRNHQLRLSGNRFLIVGLFFLSLFYVSCKPKKVILAPDSTKPVENTAKEEVSKVTESPVVDVQAIALILPFQLDKINSNRPTSQDVKRSELALDFYQGFELGLKEWTSKGYHFSIDVLDSRDNEAVSASLAKNEQVLKSRIIVGPVYPKEIKSFGTIFSKENAQVLQVSPLAATMPNEFGFSNLVSVTPPITAHIAALSKRIVNALKSGDALIFYNTSDASAKQFFPILKAEILKLKRNQVIYEVENEEQVLSHLRPNQTNHIVSGTDNRFQIIRILEEISNAAVASGARIKIFGHPTWAKLDLTDQQLLEAWDAEITTSYYVDSQSQPVKSFVRSYQSQYKIAPSEFAFKGFDLGCYLGELMAKYGVDYASKLVGRTFKGLHNNFEFEHQPKNGYINMGVHFLEYRRSGFIKAN